MSESAQLYLSVARSVALSITIYFGLRNVAPAAARASLSIGGAIAGSVLLSGLLFFLAQLYRNGWNGFGLLFWGFPIFFVGGGICGALLALRFTSRSPAGRRKLNIALSLTPLVTTALLFVLPQIVLTAVVDTRGDTMHKRSITIYGFTASQQSAAFVIPTREDANIRAILFVDRATRQAWRIADPGFSYRDPRLSWDGERLLLVRIKKGDRQHELISCAVKSWRCRVAVQTEQDVVSPVEIEKGLLLYSSSPSITFSDRQRYSRHDFYAVKLGSDPMRLTDFGLVALHSINVFDGTILFGAAGSGRDRQILAENWNVLADPRSDIFEWRIDPDTLRIPNPPSPLQPCFYVGGSSGNPAASQDGRKLAFLNTELGKGPYRYNIIAMDRDTRSQKLIKLEGKDFSRAAFTRNEMLYNELLENRYRIRAWNWQTDTIEQIFEIEFSKLEALPHISLTVEPNNNLRQP